MRRVKSRPRELFAPIDTRGMASEFFKMVNVDAELQREAGVALNSTEADEAERFKTLCPNYFPSKENFLALREYLSTHQLSFTAENLRTAWLSLIAGGRVKTARMVAEEEDSGLNYRKLDAQTDSEVAKEFEAIRSARLKRRSEIDKLLKQPIE